MAELRQAEVLAEQSIASPDTTDFSTLHTILDEVKQLNDKVKVENSKQNQDSNSAILVLTTIINHLAGIATSRNRKTVPPLLVLVVVVSVHHEQFAAHATHSVTIVII
ncbi:hypothetical protein CHS0354_016914 [Potamilus streckersoni]|uniref:Uncharacterized protein n=1 Tax=Potamilus streckersoni TaxID=2493646 RepID=A0AAE0VQQ8_9BIVA|nr:hypothetical protein CHS0354_016911 [Potamilus streckersoni]KAK3586489.1 hypothetical protein CHS0354_016914 [Potamilus streckersoni]